MQAAFILLTTLAAPPEGVPPASSTTQGQARKGAVAAQSTPRSPRELSDAVGETIRRFRRADDALRERLVPQLAALYNEVKENTQLEPRVRRRLARFLERRLREMEASLARKLEREHRSESPRRAKIAAARSTSTAAKTMATARSRTNHSSVLAQPGIGPAGGAAPAGGFGQAANRQVQDLIDLIRNTIAPSTWSINGGKGTIYYYRPAQAFVIRQTSEVHRQIGGALDQLRR